MKESGTDKKWKLPSLKNLFKKKEKPADALPEEPDDRTLLQKIWEVIRIIFLVLFRLRSVFMAIPVIYIALRLAAYNTEHLPLLVGLNLQTTGEFAKTISRQTAVTFPLFLTGGCLVLTFLSKKTIYPWLISIFSLVVPVLLLITNMYPA